jgi:hypothetical protein
MGISDEAKNVIPLKFLRKIKNKNCFPLVNSIREHTYCITKYRVIHERGISEFLFTATHYTHCNNILISNFENNYN